VRSRTALIEKVPIGMLSDADIDRLVDRGYEYAKQVKATRNKPYPLEVDYE